MSQRARLIGLLGDFISSEDINNHSKLWNVLSKWNNMARLDSFGLHRFKGKSNDRAAPDTAPDSRVPRPVAILRFRELKAGEDDKIYLHFDWQTGCLLILDLIHKQVLSVCWLDKCTRQSGGNKYLLCFECVEKYIARCMGPCKTINTLELPFPKYKSYANTDSAIYPGNHTGSYLPLYYTQAGYATNKI